MTRPIHRHSLPVTIERGADTVLTLDLRDANGEVAIPESVSLVIRSGGVTLDTFTADIDSAGAVTVDLPGDASSEWALTDALLLEWSVTIEGSLYRYRVTGAVCLTAYEPTITASDVFDRYPALRAALDESSIGSLILSTSGEIQRRIMEKGRRPYLIMDRWAVADAHLDLALWRIMDAADNALSDDRWRRAAEKHEEGYASRWASLSFRYDLAESGDVATASPEPASPVLILTAGRVGGFWR
jgi:hypothetical protein